MLLLLLRAVLLTHAKRPAMSDKVELHRKDRCSRDACHPQVARDGRGWHLPSSRTCRRREAPMPARIADPLEICYYWTAAWQAVQRSSEHDMYFAKPLPRLLATRAVVVASQHFQVSIACQVTRRGKERRPQCAANTSSDREFMHAKLYVRVVQDLQTNSNACRRDRHNHPV